ncbi:histidine kinase [Nocardioides KLBMP 9356]|uniref:Histidine kinase n=1 Tax=Nocardioides potassii TaxID=2911371 RepID=A0ABS9HAJ8_9ACTN|nr:ATP-binding protein [Nocardioides potassii]MCF6378220.1 histidine kinase [Nocardioides potassii]
MVFSGDPALRRSDLLAIVSVLDVDAVLERAVDIGADRTGALAAALAVVDEGPEEDLLEGDPAEDEPARALLRTYGIDGDAAAALRERLGAAGLMGEPGHPPQEHLSRVRDPETGAEVLRVPVVVHGRLYADLLLLEPEGGTFATEGVEAIEVLGRVTGVAVRNALSYTLSERRRESLRLAAAVDQSVQPPFLLTAPTERIADGAHRIAGARAAAVVSSGPDGIDVIASAGVVDDFLARTLASVTDEVRRAQDDQREFAVRREAHTVWGMPLQSKVADAGIVVMVLDHARPRRSTDDRELLGDFVRHASLVLDHAVLQQERHHAVLAADRDRIARDLHDVVIQRLYATSLRLRAGAASGEDVGEHVDEAIREMGESIRDIRGTIFELERGRSRSVRSDVLALAREYDAVLGFFPVVRSRGAVDSLVGPELADQATVVLREALSNCARHAAAGRCEVDVFVDSGWFNLVVTDDGRGMSASDLPGNGLRNLRSRARELGGDLVVEAAEPRGTRLSWRVPLGAQEAVTSSSGTGADSVTDAAVPVTGVEESDHSHSEASDSTTQHRPATTR